MRITILRVLQDAIPINSVSQDTKGPLILDTGCSTYHSIAKVDVQSLQARPTSERVTVFAFFGLGLLILNLHLRHRDAQP